MYDKCCGRQCGLHSNPERLTQELYTDVASWVKKNPVCAASLRCLTKNQIKKHKSRNQHFLTVGRLNYRSIKRKRVCAFCLALQLRRCQNTKTYQKNKVLRVSSWVFGQKNVKCMQSRKLRKVQSPVVTTTESKVGGHVIQIPCCEI